MNVEKLKKLIEKLGGDPAGKNTVAELLDALTGLMYGVEKGGFGFTGDTQTISFSTNDRGYAEKNEFSIYGESRAIERDGVFYVGVNVTDERPIEPVNADVYGYSCWKFYDADGNYGGAIVQVSTAGYVDVTEFHEFPANSEITIEYGEGGEVETVRPIDPKYLPEPLVVTITGPSDSLESDVSYAEIVSAIEAGRVVYAVTPSEDSVIRHPYSGEWPGEVYFTAIRGAMMETITINESGVYTTVIQLGEG